MLATTYDEIDYEEVRSLLPREAQHYLDNCYNDGYRTYALNKFIRLLYTQAERRSHYKSLRDRGYTVAQSKKMRDLAPSRLHRIIDGDTEESIFKALGLLFIPPGGRE